MAKESDNWDEAIDGLRTSTRKAREAERAIKKSVLELTRKKKNKTDQVCSSDIVSSGITELFVQSVESLIFVHRSKPVRNISSPFCNNFLHVSQVQSHLFLVNRRRGPPDNEFRAVLVIRPFVRKPDIESGREGARRISRS